jgi:hypothetical protein
MEINQSARSKSMTGLVLYFPIVWYEKLGEQISFFPNVRRGFISC